MSSTLNNMKKDFTSELMGLQISDKSFVKKILAEIKKAQSEGELTAILEKAEKYKNREDNSDFDYDYDSVIENLNDGEKKKSNFTKQLLSKIPIIKNVVPSDDDEDEEYNYTESLDSKIEELVDNISTYFYQRATWNNGIPNGPYLRVENKDDKVESIKNLLIKDPEKILTVFTDDIRRYAVDNFYFSKFRPHTMEITEDHLYFSGTGSIYGQTVEELNLDLDKLGRTLQNIYLYKGKIADNVNTDGEDSMLLMPNSNMKREYVSLYLAAKQIVDQFNLDNHVDSIDEEGALNIQKLRNKAKVYGKYVLPILFIAVYLFKPFAIGLQSVTMFFWVTTFLMITMFIYREKEQKKWVRAILLWPAVIFLVYLSGMYIYGQPFLDNGVTAYHQIGTVKEITPKDYSKFEFSKDRTYVVNATMARSIADKVIGQDGTSSKYQIGVEALQNIKVNGQNKLYWVFSLIYGNIFSQFSNGKVDKAILVDANDPSKSAQLVSTNTKGEKYNITLLQGGYLWQDITTMMQYLNPTKMLTDYSFELDDDLNPHYIVSVYSYTKGFNYRKIDGIIDVDLQHGNKQTYYDANKVPSWVDRVIPLDVAQEQITNNGEFVHGAFNFSNLDKYMSSLNATVTQTSGATSTISNDASTAATNTTQPAGNIPAVQTNVNYVFFNHHPYFLTGITSKGGDGALQGFIIKSLNDNETFKITTTGAIEAAAKQSAQGITQNYNYTAANPILVFAQGKLQYLIPLVDSAGLIKKYALVDVQHYQSVKLFDSLDSFIKGEQSDSSFSVPSQNGASGTTSTSTSSKEEIMKKLKELEEMVKSLKE